MHELFKNRLLDDYRLSAAGCGTYSKHYSMFWNIKLRYPTVALLTEFGIYSDV